MKAISAALACCLIAAASLSAAIYVPSDQPTIQAGINVANPNDTVYVLPGIYTGDGNRDLTFGGKNITLLSTAGPGATIIDCEGSPADPHIGIFLDNGEDSTAWIEGFTITGAYADGFSGAIFGLHGAASIRACIITGNAIPGITLSNYSTHTRILNCNIFDNAQSGIGYIGTSAQIDGCRITGNGNNGITCIGNLTLTGTLIANNVGFGVFIASAVVQPAVITNCTIVGNQVGLWFEQEMPKHESAELLQNHSVSNTIIAFNDEEGVRLVLNGYPQFTCIDNYGNGLGNWRLDVGYTLDTTGCFSLDPLFCDLSAGAFSILASSPCAPENNVCAVLIGSEGYPCSCCEIRGDVDHSATINIADITYLVQFFFQGEAPLPCYEEGNTDGIGNVNISDLTYLVAFIFQGGAPPMPCW